MTQFDGEPEWYEADPRKALEWAREFMVADLRSSAEDARETGDRLGRFWDGKADLLHEILSAALGTSAASPEGGPSLALEDPKTPSNTQPQTPETT